MKHLMIMLMVCVFAIGGIAQTTITEDDNSVTVSINKPVKMSKLIDLAIKARTSGTIKYTKRLSGVNFILSIVYESSTYKVYLIEDNGESLLNESTKVSDIRTFVKQYLLE